MTHTIETILVLSTAHISPATAAIMDHLTALRGVICHPKSGGWFVYTGELSGGHPPDDLARLIAGARKAGCVWLMLDNAAGEDSAFPIFDW